MKVPEMSSFSVNRLAVTPEKHLGVTPIKSNKSQGAARIDRLERGGTKRNGLLLSHCFQ
jgi:hypothetical protein